MADQLSTLLLLLMLAALAAALQLFVTYRMYGLIVGKQPHCGW
jgi:hypothetical protein